MKKFLSLLAVFFFAIVLVGCKKPVDDNNDDNNNDDQTSAGTLAEGYTSLANQNANGEIDAEGYYSIAGLKLKTKDSYKTTYTTEPTNEKFNYLINTWTYNSEHYTNMVDGLVENDKYSNIVGALALGYKAETNADGTQSWYFQLREDANWVDNKTGQVYSQVVAQNFVDSIKYVLDPINGSGTATIVTGLVKGALEYYESKALGVEADFATVGVEAVSKFVVKYTLIEETPYFLSSLTYSPFLPVDGAYLESKGTDFGISEDNILVNGAFRITEHQENAKMVYTKNDKYYDAKHVYVNTVEKVFYSGTITDRSTTRQWYENGNIDAFSVNADDQEGWAKYVAGPEGTGTLKAPANELCNSILSVGDATYIGYYNFDRTFFEYNEPDNVKSDAQKAATTKAVGNANFRKGFLYSLNVMEYLKIYDPAEPFNWLMRGYTNRELCAANNMDYADYVDKVYNEKQGTTGVSLTGIINGSDPIYNLEKAGQFFAQAKQELIAGGLTEADFPIQIDVVGAMSLTTQAYENAMYAGISAASNGVVEIVSNIPQSDQQEVEWSSLNANYDFSLWSGWGPDYADPKTFLETCSINGSMVEYFGFDNHDAENMQIQNAVLGEFDALYRKAIAITDPTKTVERFEAMAEAEYNLIYESAIIIPWLSQNGYSASVSNTVPYQAGRATYGLTGDKLKNVVVVDQAVNPITQSVRAAVVADYNANK